MKRFHVLTALAAVQLAATGCIFGYSPVEYIVPPPKAQSNYEAAARTVAQLKTLAVGQPRHEVVARMGAAPVEGCVEWSWADVEFYLRHNGWLRCVKTAMIPSPYRTTTFESGGARYEVLFYYTGGTGPDGGIADPQLTPVLLKNDQLAGWGWNHPLVKELGPNFSPAQPVAAPAPSATGLPRSQR